MLVWFVAVLLYVREEDDHVFTALMLEYPTVECLLMAVSIDSSRVDSAIGGRPNYTVVRLWPQYNIAKYRWCSVSDYESGWYIM